METPSLLLPTMPLLLTDAQNLLSDLIARYHSQVDYLVIRPEEAEGLIFCCVATVETSAKASRLVDKSGLVIKVAGVEQL